MKNEIKVEFGITGNSHGSFEEAVVASKARSKLLKEKVSSINGKVMIGYNFNGFDLSIEFENGKYLSISPGSNIITLDVIPENPGVDSSLTENNVSFLLPDGKELTVETQNILNHFLNKKIVIAPSDQYIFIFQPKGIEYMFTYLVDINNPNKKYLHLSEC